MTQSICVHAICLLAIRLGPTSKHATIGSATSNAKSDSAQTKTVSPPVANVSKNDASFIPASTPVSTQGSKSMSHISGVRRDLSRGESFLTDVEELPKYGIQTDRETELGEVGI